MSHTSIASLYKSFRTDNTKESSGIMKRFGPITLKLARAGGSNDKYRRVFAEVFEEYQRMMELNELPEEKTRELLYTVYARSIILDWFFYDQETKTDVRGLYRDDQNNVVLFNEKNVVDLFKNNCHELFLDIRTFVENRESFLFDSVESAAKN